ncbi:hypothetical protein SUSAZ_10290 [Sulfolobus acidocaldarius SUSAZ]|nr:hypothetical protein SUSAZ_10290 [Sulfolobus acidocaldarius SUSAZ]
MLSQDFTPWIALALTSYFWRTLLPHATLLYHLHKLALIMSLRLTLGMIFLLIKVLRVNGGYYYLWVVRHYESGLVLFFMLTSLRSGFHVYVILNGINLENWRDKVIFVHDKALAYKEFNWRGMRLKRLARGTW